MLKTANFDEADPYAALPSIASIRAAVLDPNAARRDVGARAAAVLSELFCSELCLAIFKELAPWDALAASQVCRRLRHVAQSRKIPRRRRPLPPLPDELWLEILRYLWEDGMLAASQVCKRLRAIALGEQGLWTTVTLETRDGTPAPSVFGLEQVLARSGVRTIWLRRTIVGGVLPAWEAAVGAALAPHAARIHGLRITYEEPAQLAALSVFASAESPFPNLHGLELKADLLDVVSWNGTLNQHPGASLLVLDNDGPRFPNLRSCISGLDVFWQDVPVDMCTALTSLEIDVLSIDEVFDALLACPVLATLTVVVEDAIPPPNTRVDATLAARIYALSTVHVRGLYAQATCHRLVVALAFAAPHGRFSVECEVFWSTLAALFIVMQGLSAFSHDCSGGMHTVRGTTAQGRERLITAPKEYGDDEAWEDFYDLLLDTLASLPQDAVVVPAQYRSLIAT